jgi:hypothetical protein
MRRSPRPRRIANFSESLHKQLNAYSIAAGAAGVGLLALTPPAEAKIVYTPVNAQLSRNEPFSIVLNPDGKNTFFLLLRNFISGSRFATEYLAVCHRPYTIGGNWFCTHSTSAPNALNQVRARVGSNFAAVLRAGAKIENGDRFLGKGGAVVMGGVGYNASGSTTAPRWWGPWVNDGKGVKNRFLGLKFKLNGTFHFGWARLTVTSTPPHGFAVKLMNYAYETIPGKGIIAGQTKELDEIDNSIDQPNPSALRGHIPEPATLGALALGAPGLSIWRRKETSLDGQ